MEVSDFKLYVSLLLCTFIAVGVLGNIVSISVWTKGPRCSKTLFSFYFKILAITDIFVLLVPGAEFLLHFNPIRPVSLRNINDSFCRLFNFCVNFGFEFSAWITVMLTTERTLALCLPFKFYKPSMNLTICRFFTVCMMILVLLAANIPYIIEMEVIDRNKNLTGSDAILTPICDFSSESSRYIFMITVLFFHIGTPIPIAVICNVIIIVKLCRGKKLTTVSNKVRNKSIKHLTILTVCISIIHCVSTLPETLLWFELIPGHQFTIVLSNVSLYLNNSLHCLLYCLVGTDFRQDLKHICKCGQCCIT